MERLVQVVIDGWAVGSLYGALALAVVVIVASAITAYCHRPPGPGNPRTISVPANAVPSHLAHGDSVGPCPSGN